MTYVIIQFNAKWKFILAIKIHELIIPIGDMLKKIFDLSTMRNTVPGKIKEHSYIRNT